MPNATAVRLHTKTLHLTLGMHANHGSAPRRCIVAQPLFRGQGSPGEETVELKNGPTKISVERSDNLRLSSANNVNKFLMIALKLDAFGPSRCPELLPSALVLTSESTWAFIVLPTWRSLCFCNKNERLRRDHFCRRGAWMRHAWQLFHYHSHRWLHWRLTTERLTSTFANTPLIYSQHILNFFFFLLLRGTCWQAAFPLPQKHIYQKKWGRRSLFQLEARRVSTVQTKTTSRGSANSKRPSGTLFSDQDLNGMVPPQLEVRSHHGVLVPG